ncbi:MAG: hypothetical protein CMG62_08780 [Candidatus Marinimicrobia bacterium]|nr:hypothetical protein [Candidatus Neomarinimicrobiota bacterium]|tara:strand:+ start:5588 stop:5953 length:366 start_codon:yes stop_codon:yes gene_type:complete
MTKINFQNVHTMVGADAVIDGPINLREGIIIYGTVKGPVNTNGPVRVAENGNVHGNIIGSDIRIGGTVSGNLVAAGQVILGKKSILNGDIVYRKLLIEDGAQFNGKCDLIIEDQEESSNID